MFKADIANLKAPIAKPAALIARHKSSSASFVVCRAGIPEKILILHDQLKTKPP